MSREPARVIHFVTGGFSGATQVALDLVRGARQSGRTQPLLVLRHKRQTPPERIATLAAEGLAVRTVPGWAHLATVAALGRLCREFRPQALVAHGYSEHIWGRRAGMAAGVPVLLHVEHNIERYTWWRTLQARQLVTQTQATVAVSSDVAANLRRLRLAAPDLHVIHNGIDVDRFATGAKPLADRAPDIAMVARFARQKDHETLLRATRLLVDRGWRGNLHLAGGGKASHRDRAKQLVLQLGLADQVVFHGRVENVPALLRACRVAVLATRHEGLPLSLVEGLAAGCAVVASRATGVTDIVRPEADGEPRTGWLAPVGDAERLAECLRAALDSSTAQARADLGRADALARFSRPRMVAAYEDLVLRLVAEGSAGNTGAPSGT